MVASWPLPLAGASDGATLDVAPSSGPCGTFVAIRGAGYVSGEGGQLAEARAGGDGTFAVTVPLLDCGGIPARVRFTLFATRQPAAPRDSGIVPATAVFTLSAAAVGPTFVLEPDRGPCGAPVTARGAVFSPGKAVRFLALQVGTDNGAEFAGTRVTVAATGTCAVPLSLVGFGGGATAAAPDGTRFLLSALTGADPGAVAAQATVTVTAGPVRCFAETGRCIGGPLRAYWEAHGRDLGDPGVSCREPLAAFGYPLSEEFAGQLAAGAAHRVPYFERARVEYRPDDRAPREVLLGQPGRRLLAESRGR